MHQARIDLRLGCYHSVARLIKLADVTFLVISGVPVELVLFRQICVRSLL